MLRVLLIDDNPADEWLAKEAMREAGLEAQILAVRDGAEARQLLLEYGGRESFPHDLVILDLNLPRVDGIRLLDEFAKGVLSKCAVLVTSSAVSAAAVASVELLANATYLQKPGNLDELTQMGLTIRGLLKSRHLE